MLLLLLFAFSSAAPVPPILPDKFAWIIHLLEYHHYVDNGQPKVRTTVTEGQYYFDYTQRPIFATRQQNVVLPNSWRPDLPWNVFLGVDGIIRVGVFNYTSGEVRCALKGIPYGNDYWPKDFLLNPDTCHFKGITTLPEVFNGTMQDGKKGYAYYCTLPAFNMTAYVDVVTNQLLRVSIDENLPVWNKQIWDTVTFVEMDFVAGFWEIPQWLQNCPQS